MEAIYEYLRQNKIQNVYKVDFMYVINIKNLLLNQDLLSKVKSIVYNWTPFESVIGDNVIFFSKNAILQVEYLWNLASVYPRFIVKDTESSVVELLKVIEKHTIKEILKFFNNEIKWFVLNNMEFKISYFSPIKISLYDYFINDEASICTLGGQYLPNQCIQYKKKLVVDDKFKLCNGNIENENNLADKISDKIITYISKNFATSDTKSFSFNFNGMTINSPSSTPSSTPSFTPSSTTTPSTQPPPSFNTSFTSSFNPSFTSSFTPPVSSSISGSTSTSTTSTTSTPSFTSSFTPPVSSSTSGSTSTSTPSFTSSFTPPVSSCTSTMPASTFTSSFTPSVSSTTFNSPFRTSSTSINSTFTPYKSPFNSNDKSANNSFASFASSNSSEFKQPVFSSELKMPAFNFGK